MGQDTYGSFAPHTGVLPHMGVLPLVDHIVFLHGRFTPHSLHGHLTPTHTNRCGTKRPLLCICFNAYTEILTEQLLSM